MTVTAYLKNSVTGAPTTLSVTNWGTNSISLLSTFPFLSVTNLFMDQRELSKEEVQRPATPYAAKDQDTSIRAFRDQVVSLRLAGVRRLIDRAIERGELRSDVDVMLVQELLFGPLFYRLLLTGKKLDNRLAERVVDAVLPGIVSTRSETIQGRASRQLRARLRPSTDGQPTQS